MQRNRQWLIAERPNGRAIAKSDFQWREHFVERPGPNEVLVRNEILSFEPAQKALMENLAGYVSSELGDVMGATGIGQVVESNSAMFGVGEKVMGPLGWQDYATLSDGQLQKVENDQFLTENLSILGEAGGLTSFFGIAKVALPVPGDTMVVTGATGVVGSAVGQIGKIAGCRVIGVARGETKCRALVEDLGFDASIDASQNDVKEQLKAAAPEGVDIVWDNVGGPMLNILLGRINMYARIVICGASARYELASMPGPEKYFNLVFKRARMEGMQVTQFKDEYEWGRRRLKNWIREGKLQYKQEIYEGLENAPDILLQVFSSNNQGKLLIKLI